MTHETPQEILTEAAKTYERKNADYGDAWRLVGKTLSLWCRHAGADELAFPTDPETLNSLGLFTRRLDKIIRAFNGEFLVDDLNYESIRDSHTDEATYAAIHASLLAEQEPVEYVRDKDVQEIDPTLNIEDFSIGHQMNANLENAEPEPTTEHDRPVDPAYEAEFQRRVSGD